MASPTVQPREPHNENERSNLSEHSVMRPESITSGRSTRSPPSGSKHILTADRKVRSVEAVQAMEDLEAETGFASYAAYSESLEYNFEYRGRFWDKYMRGLKFSRKPNSHCAIVDLFNEEASPPKASLRCEGLSADQTLQSLRTPPKGVAVQIVLWSFDEDSDQVLDPQFVTVFGLGLKLDPHFFVALAAKSGRDKYMKRSVDEGTLREYLFLDGTVVAIARDCPLAKPGTPPILLIAKLRRLDYHIPKSALHYSMREAPPAPHLREVQIYAGDPTLYTRLLAVPTNRIPDCTIGGEALLFRSLLPLLQLDILRMRSRCFHVRSTFQGPKYRSLRPIRAEFQDPLFDERISESTFDDTADAKLYPYRVFLRSSIEGFEGPTEPLAQFISSQLAPELTTGPAYYRIAEERGLILREALRLEAEIRDFLQLQNGQLSLLESRKSIEVSNNQLQEGKRVKIFTILAFVYIPLNLATSIFGMNLQQLNGSGKSVKYFVVTALVALIITGGSWWLAEQWGSLRAWRRRDPESYQGPKTLKTYARPTPNYGILVRAGMLVWLVTHGHWSWMVRSGAGWCTLTNSRRINQGYHPNGKDLFAGDYLSKFIRIDYDPHDFDIYFGWWNGEISP